MLEKSSSGSVSIRFNLKYREEIIDYLEQGGIDSGIQLSDKAQVLLTRWRYADEVIRENRYKRELVAQKIVNKFGVSRDTAYKDIVNAEMVFASSTPLNKRYWIQNRIEYLQQKIDDCYIDKDRISAAMLEKTLMKLIELYPDYAPPRAPQAIIFNITNNYQFNITPEQAFENAEYVIEQMSKDGTNGI